MLLHTKEMQCVRVFRDDGKDFLIQDLCLIQCGSLLESHRKLDHLINGKTLRRLGARLFLPFATGVSHLN
jgi:hypothetical protein